MFRIAIIQNGVEMQHSGYVDAFPLYRNFAPIGKDKAEFTRFSGVNIGELFSVGEKFILDFDALILGTNATSDDDVYNVLRKEQSKKLLEEFIEAGKGLLICSQKKYQRKKETVGSQEYKLFIRDAEDLSKSLSENGSGEIIYHKEEVVHSSISHKRITAILPEHYEYVVDERPADEGSNNGGVSVVALDTCNQIQKCILNLPNRINNEIISRHCENNSFQKHYYRDIIKPVYDSAYSAVLIDEKNASDIRNLLMVAVPQKKERIVISTMALDWAGHIELLENIVNYLTRGIPHTAFVHKDNFDNNEMKVLTMDAELSKVGYAEYSSIKDYLNNVNWHSLVVFSPDFSEEDVSKAWQKIKCSNPFTKAYHYRTVAGELVLVEYSNNDYIEQQKIDVLAWLHSKRGKRLWDNSLWKTFDVAKLLHTIQVKSCKSILQQIVEGITIMDDNEKRHYKNGGYDGVLAPTCGVMEILYWANDEKDLKTTKQYLLNRYETLSDHNKKFVIRAFYKCNDFDNLQKLIKNFSLNNDSVSEMTDIDLCLQAEIAMILYKSREEGQNTNKNIVSCTLSELCSRQMQNGKWDNLGNTANILNFLLNYRAHIREILREPVDQSTLDKLTHHIDRGIAAIKTAYSVKNFNWENNIVTTANALLALCLYDTTSQYQSKDFLRNFVKESQNASSYNALNLALQTLDKSVEESNSFKKSLYEEKEKNRSLIDYNTKVYKHLYIASAIAGFSLFGLIAIFILLWVKYTDAFKGLIGEVFMWVPIAIGLAITPLVTFIIKKISTVKKEKKLDEDKK